MYFSRGINQTLIPLQVLKNLDVLPSFWPLPFPFSNTEETAEEYVLQDMVEKLILPRDAEEDDEEMPPGTGPFDPFIKPKPEPTASIPGPHGHLQTAQQD